MSNLISIGLSGLSASQTSLSTTSNNISNADTAGYSRQSAISKAGALQSIGGAGYVGTGTTISEVRRIYSEYLQNQVNSSTSLDAEAQSYSTEISSLDSLLSDSATGITSVLSSFYSSLQTLSSTPADTSARQLLLTSASTLSNRFNSISQQLTQQQSDINTQLSTLSGQVNQLSSTVATLNKQITTLAANGSTTSLLDARDEAVRQLNELVGVSVQTTSNGSYDVYLGTGQSLVTGYNTNTLSAQASTSDPTQYSLTVNYGSYTSDVTSVVSGGSIGGLLRYRSDVLNPTINSLGRMAMAVSDSVNSQLGQGVDANGSFGSSLFSDINSAAAISQRSLASPNNKATTGNLDVTIANTGALTTYDYQVTFSGADAFSVTRSDGTNMGSYSLGDTPVIDGFTLAMDGGAASSGDTFKITPTRNGASTMATVMTDSSQLAMGGALSATSGTGNSGTGSITQPTLTTTVGINGGSSTTTALQSAIQTNMPVKLVFDTVSNGAQAYTVYNSSGDSIGTGSIVPGQGNDLSVSIPLVDANGVALKGSDGKALAMSFAMTVSGSPAAGDSYSVAFNSNGTSDNRNATALLGLQTAGTIGKSATNAGTSITNTYASLVEGVGAMASQATIDTTATSAVLTSATSSRDSVSGVNLDEEAANLVKYQQYYTASSQIIKTAQTIFDTLMNAL